MSTRNVRALCALSAVYCWSVTTPDVSGQIIPPNCYVDDDATPAGADGQSWATAFPDLQQALDAGPACNVTWVAEGTYVPTTPRPAGIAPKRVSRV